MAAWDLTTLRNLDTSLTRTEVEVRIPIGPVAGFTVTGSSLVEVAGVTVAEDAIVVGRLDVDE
jgi:hypothetical protein